MLDKKVGIFNAFIFFGIAALFFPATALENSIAYAQGEEMYPLPYEKEERSSNGYYYNNDNYYEEEENNNYYTYNKDKIKNDPIVKIKKKLFVCENIQDATDSFQCVETIIFPFPARPNSGQYIECTEELCPLIDESDFGAQIFKDVATVRALTPEGTPVNLDKLHYSITEGALSEISNGIGLDICEPSGFSHSIYRQAFSQDTAFLYSICVNYVGDCNGTIYPGEVKTCTVENYIWSGAFSQPGNAIDDTTTGTTTPNTNTQSSNTEGEIPNTALSVPLDSIS
ncbi:MAG TPA: hypothetical protein VLA74_03470 [Nitrososphaeraceae archaeon]|nr:hypothetical protein [Nitrososphaeraceae archaeon]